MQIFCGLHSIHEGDILVKINLISPCGLAVWKRSILSYLMASHGTTNQVDLSYYNITYVEGCGMMGSHQSLKPHEKKPDLLN
jgi:hypothetical protein